MARTWVFACVFALAIVPAAQAASLSKSYSYFTIRGKTLDEIQEQLDRRGPRLRETGRRHAGATRMEFKTHAGYRERNGRCEVTSGKVTLVARVILSRWSQRGASEDVRLVWETLAADIVKSWTGDPTQRKVIRDASFTQTGIGVATKGGDI